MNTQFKSITRKSDGYCVVRELENATSVIARMKGLLGRNNLPIGRGLLIEPCNSVHTWFMRFSIDVVYLSKEMRVLKINRDMKPWRVDFPVRHARSVLELASGAAYVLAEGDELCIN
ncbi:MAG TPA: DUF192 domain-containing protein [Oligoflexia bacterium]|nr:DUF192 domain-containing protein [Oligoflexia bacterium]